MIVLYRFISIFKLRNWKLLKERLIQLLKLAAVVDYISLVCFPIFLTGCSSVPTTSTRLFLSGEKQLVKIYFQYSFWNKLDTFDKTYQKDLGTAGFATIPFEFTKVEQQLIIEKMDSVNLFSLPDSIPLHQRHYMDPSPAQRQLIVKYKDRYKVILWTYQPDTSIVVKKFSEFRDFLIQMIESRQEVKSLPPFEGFRL